MSNEINYLYMFITTFTSFFVAFMVKDFYDIWIRPHIVFILKNYLKAYKKGKKVIIEKIGDKKI